ncbi:MAG: nucleotidyltransferase domain-containing protein, partial [Candidatus Parvarchaeota archaeon]|nr:nucleotidyltransferase domain-containing protein [Candidatus Parvarchaeota archaeon]
MEENNEEGKLKLIGYDAAYKFAKDIFVKYPRVIKSIILFGSYSKGKETQSSDVDIMIVMDDILNKLDESFLGVFYKDVDEHVKEERSIKLHINFVTLTAFWKGVLNADPVSVNVLKYGVALVDTGYFEPLQVLLQRGEIKPTEESIYAALSRSQLYYDSAKLRMAGAVLDLYWSVINSAQALIMRNGDVPPSPELIGEMMDSLQRMSVISKEDVESFNELYSIGKRLMHN